MSASVPNIKWYKESSTSVLPLADEHNSKVFKVPEPIANPVKPLEESQNPSSDNKLIEAKMENLNEIQEKLAAMNDQLILQQEEMLRQHGKIQQKQMEHFRVLEQSYKKENDRIKSSRRWQDETDRRYADEWSSQLKETFESVQSDFQLFLHDVSSLKKSVLDTRDEAKKQVKSLMHQIQKVGREYLEIQQVMNSSPIDALMNPDSLNALSRRKKKSKKEAQNGEDDMIAESTQQKDLAPINSTKAVSQPVRKVEAKFYQETLDSIKQFGMEADELVSATIEPKRKSSDVVSGIIRNIVNSVEDDDERKRWPLKLDYFMSREYLDSFELDEPQTVRNVARKGLKSVSSAAAAAKKDVVRRKATPTVLKKPPTIIPKRPVPKKVTKSSPPPAKPKVKPVVVKRPSASKPKMTPDPPAEEEEDWENTMLFQTSNVNEANQPFVNEDFQSSLLGKTKNRNPDGHRVFDHLQVINQNPPSVPFTIPSPSISPVSGKVRNGRAPLHLHQDPREPGSPPKPPFPYNLQISEKPVFLRRTTVRPVTLSFLSSPMHVPKQKPPMVVSPPKKREPLRSVNAARVVKNDSVSSISEQESKDEIIRESQSSLDIHDVATLERKPTNPTIRKTRNVKLQVSLKEPQVLERNPVKTHETQTDDLTTGKVDRGTDGMDPPALSSRGIQHETYVPIQDSRSVQTAEKELYESAIQTDRISTPPIVRAKTPPLLVHMSTSPVEFSESESTDGMEYSITKTVRKYQAVAETTETSTNTLIVSYRDQGNSPPLESLKRNENTQTIDASVSSKNIQTADIKGPETAHMTIQTMDPLRTSQFSQSEVKELHSYSTQTMEEEKTPSRPVKKQIETQYSPPAQVNMGTQSDPNPKIDQYDQIIQTYLDDEDEAPPAKISHDAHIQTTPLFLSIEDVVETEPQIVEVIRERVVEVERKAIASKDEGLQTESSPVKSIEIQTNIEMKSSQVGTEQTSMAATQVQTEYQLVTGDQNTQTFNPELIDTGIDPVSIVSLYSAATNTDPPALKTDFNTQTESILMMEKSLETLIVDMKESPLIQTDPVDQATDAVQTDDAKLPEQYTAFTQTTGLENRAISMQTEEPFVTANAIIQTQKPILDSELFISMISHSWYQEILDEILMDMLVGLLAIEIREDQIKLFWVEEEEERIVETPKTPLKAKLSSKSSQTNSVSVSPTRSHGIQTKMPSSHSVATETDDILELLRVQRRTVEMIQGADYVKKAKISIPVVDRISAAFSAKTRATSLAKKIQVEAAVAEPIKSAQSPAPSVPAKKAVIQVQPIPTVQKAFKESLSSSVSSETSSALSSQPSLGQLVSEMYSDGEMIQDHLFMPELSYQDIEQGEIVPPERFKKSRTSRSRSIHRMVQKLWKEVRVDDDNDGGKRSKQSHDPLVYLSEDAILSSAESDADGNKENDQSTSSSEDLASTGELFNAHGHYQRFVANLSDHSTSSPRHSRQEDRHRHIRPQRRHTYHHDPTAFFDENGEPMYSDGYEEEIESLASSIINSLSMSS